MQCFEEEIFLVKTSSKPKVVVFPLDTNGCGLCVCGIKVQAKTLLGDVLLVFVGFRAIIYLGT